MRVCVRERLDDWGADWDSIVDRMKTPSPFLKSWWVDNVATAPTAVVCCLEGDTLVGGAAFQVTSVRPRAAGLEVVRFVGQGPLSPDHLDVVAAPAERAEVVRRVVGWLQRPGARIIDLDGLVASSGLRTMPGAAVLDRHISPFCHLPDDGATFLASREGSLRSTIKRTGKRLERDGIVLRRPGPEDAERALNDLARLHESRWTEESEFLDDWNAFSRAALVGMRRGDVVIHELATPDGETIASEMELVAGDRIGFYQAGRDTDHRYRGSGSVLKFGILQWAIASGFREFDLLRGAESYKAAWSDDQNELVRIVAGAGLRGRTTAQAAVLYIRAVRAAVEMRRSRRCGRVDPQG